MKIIQSCRLLLMLLAGISFLFSCKKDAGEGGTSTIKGKVIVYNYDNAFLTVQDTFPAEDEDVFIIYGGNGSLYDDKYATTFDGTYQFKYLQKGDYKLFAYTKDTTGAYNGTLDLSKPKIPVFINVSITEKGSTVTGPDIIILKSK